MVSILATSNQPCHTSSVITRTAECSPQNSRDVKQIMWTVIVLNLSRAKFLSTNDKETRGAALCTMFHGTGMMSCWTGAARLPLILFRICGV
jgi:hypothetical protein